MSEYEQAICFSVATCPMVWMYSDSMAVRFASNVNPILVPFFIPHFPQMIVDGLMDKVETYPTDGYHPNKACFEKAQELWKSIGKKPYYVMPGVLVAK